MQPLSSLLQSAQGPGPPARPPGHNTWTTEKAPWGAGMCGHTVICSEHDGMNKNAGFQQNCMAPFIGFVHPFCISQSIVGGRWHNCRFNWWNVNGAAIKKKKKKTKHLFIFLKKKGFKRSLWKDFRWQRSFLSDWYQTSSACSCFSQWTSCHVPTWW